MIIANLLSLLVSVGTVIATKPTAGAEKQTFFLEKNDIPVAFTLDAKNALKLRSFKKGLKTHGLSMSDLRDLSFENIQSKDVVMSLPVEFFDMLTPEQMQQIARNEDLNELLTGKFKVKVGRRGRETDLVKRKLGALYRHLETVTRQTIGDRFDALMGRMSTKIYKYLDPIAALSSKKFKNTVRGFAGLFGLSRRQFARETAVLKSRRAEKKHFTAMSTTKTNFIQEIGSYVSQFVNATKDNLILVTVAIAFQLMERGIPMPPFMTSRIARIVSQVAAKASEKRFEGVQAKSAVLLEKLNSKSAQSDREMKPCRIAAAVPRVLGQVLTVAENIYSSAQSLSKAINELGASGSSQAVRNFLTSIASIASTAYAANGLILGRDVLHQVGLTCPSLLRTVVKAEQSITHDFTAIAKISKGVLTTYGRLDGNNEADFYLMRSGLRSIKDLADKLYSDIAELSKTIMETSESLAGLTRREKRHLLFSQKSGESKKASRSPRLFRRLRRNKPPKEKHPVNPDVEVEYEDAVEPGTDTPVPVDQSPAPVEQAPGSAAPQQSGLLDVLLDLANNWTSVTPFGRKH